MPRVAPHLVKRPQHETEQDHRPGLVGDTETHRHGLDDGQCSQHQLPDQGREYDAGGPPRSATGAPPGECEDHTRHSSTSAASR